MIIICLCGCKKYKTTPEIINDAKGNVSEMSIKLIFNAVETAYTQAMLNSFGSKPTIDDVRNNFSYEHATWTGNVITTDLGFECNVNVDNNVLKIKCLDEEFNHNLILR